MWALEMKVIFNNPDSNINFLHLDMEAAPKIGFNLTYSCPGGMVFNHDWFATPFILMTCQVMFLFILEQFIFSVYFLRILVFLTNQTGIPMSVFCVSQIQNLNLFKREIFLATTTECFDCTTTSKFD